MSVIGGATSIITSGLVYALDFSNPRSYNANSGIVNSILYDPVLTSVNGATSFDGKSINFTGSSTTYIQRTGSITNFNPTGDFTICLVANTQQSGSAFIQNTATVNFAAFIGTSSFDIGFYNPITTTYYTRRFPVTLNSKSTYIACRYTNGTLDLFIDGLPFTSSQTGVSIPTLAQFPYQSILPYYTGSLYLGAIPSTTVPYTDFTAYSGSLSQVYIYNRALTSTEIYSNYVPHITSQYQLPVLSQVKPYTLDENTLMYVSASGVTSSTYIAAIDTFITGLKSNNLWNKLSAIYPAVGSTTSSQALNLKEPGVNRLVYSGSWTASTSGSYPSSLTSYLQLAGFDYPAITTSSAHITYLSYDLPQATASLVGIDKPLRALGGETYYSGSRTYHIFKITGTSSFQVVDPSLTAVEVFAVGGGGAGGGQIGGGGGAGGLVYSSSFTVSPGNIQVIVGTGAPYTGVDGFNTQFGSIIAYGGGRGGSYNAGAGNSASGSGGGGGAAENPGTGSNGLSVTSQGNNGGKGYYFANQGGGGGGGAGSVGQEGNAVAGKAGNGGSGSYYAQYAGLGVGSPAGWFAGGGAGVGYSTVGTGGIGGGGGVGGSYSITNRAVVGLPGTINTGGGGMGGAYFGVTSGAGGSGIVIISYSSSQAAFTSSFGLSISGSSIVGNLHSTTTSGITGGGIVGLVTVSRTGSTNISLHQDITSSIISAPVTASILGSVYGNASNYAGVPSKFGTTTLSYLSYGAGLAPSEVSSYHTLVSKLQYDLGRGLLIQGYPAAAAYSVRQLSKTARYAMTVRRDSDNLTFDVGFDNNGNLNTGSLLTNMTASGITTTLPGDYSGLAAAYSLRRVSSSYSGYAIDVRRDSDNTTGSIGFNLVGGLDTGSLLAFVTGSANTGSGFVARWYDQSTNGRHATQTTSSRQPLIISSGSLVTDGGKLAIQFDAVDDGMLTDVSILKPFSIFTQFSQVGSDSIRMINSNTVNSLISSTRGDGHAVYTIGDIVSSSYATNGQRIIGSLINNNTDTKYYFNNNNITTNTQNSDFGVLAIGASTAWFEPGSGKITELLVYNNDQTSNKGFISDNINGYYNIFTQSLASSSGYVTQWYDQSGNGNHATQTATGSQPLIVRSGSFITASGKLLLDFDGVNDFLNIANNFTGTFANLSAVAKLKNDTPANEVAAPIIGSVGSSTGYGLYYKQNGLNEEFGITTRIQYNNFSTPLLSNLHNYIINVKDNTFNAYLNNTNIHSTTGISIGFRTTGNPRIGSHVGGSLTNYISGSIAEVIVWTTDQVANRLTISNNVNSYFNIY